jgi:hypothetical protein
VVDWLGPTWERQDDGFCRDDGFYPVISRLLPYKNVDAIVRSFAGAQRRLVVVGRGPQAERLRTSSYLKAWDRNSALSSDRARSPNRATAFPLSPRYFSDWYSHRAGE